MALITDARLPLHIRVRDELLRRISDRIWTAGEALPGEDRLAAELSISVGTMRKVIQSLVQEGVLERVHGKGTFVTSAFERTSMLRFVRFRGPGENTLPKATILQLTTKKASGEIASKLQLKPGASVIYMHRSRSYDDEVVLVEHIWLSHKRFSKLLPYLQTESPPLLYPVYDSVCGVLVHRAIDELEMDSISSEDAKVFDVPVNSSCMRIERVMHDHAGDVVEWRVSFVPANRFHYTVEIR
ncbi:GntR family transcriptional regulator [Advenella kashmirensis]